MRTICHSPASSRAGIHVFSTNALNPLRAPCSRMATEAAVGAQIEPGEDEAEGNRQHTLRNGQQPPRRPLLKEGRRVPECPEKAEAEARGARADTLKKRRQGVAPPAKFFAKPAAEDGTQRDPGQGGRQRREAERRDLDRAIGEDNVDHRRGDGGDQRDGERGQECAWALVDIEQALEHTGEAACDRKQRHHHEAGERRAELHGQLSRIGDQLSPAVAAEVWIEGPDHAPADRAGQDKMGEDESDDAREGGASHHGSRNY